MRNWLPLNWYRKYQILHQQPRRSRTKEVNLWTKLKIFNSNCIVSVLVRIARLWMCLRPVQSKSRFYWQVSKEAPGNIWTDIVSNEKVWKRAGQLPVIDEIGKWQKARQLIVLGWRYLTGILRARNQEKYQEVVGGRVRENDVERHGQRSRSWPWIKRSGQSL